MPRVYLRIIFELKLINIAFGLDDIIKCCVLTQPDNGEIIMKKKLSHKHTHARSLRELEIQTRTL